MYASLSLSKRYINIHVFFNLVSLRLVEEYMLIANFLVAQKLVMGCQSKALLRSHPKPVKQGMSSLQPLFDKLFSGEGSKFDPSSAGSLHDSLLELEKIFASNKEVYEACMTILTHPMKPAVSILTYTAYCIHSVHGIINTIQYNVCCLSTHTNSDHIHVGVCCCRGCD